MYYHTISLHRSPSLSPPPRLSSVLRKKKNWTFLEFYNNDLVSSKGSYRSEKEKGKKNPKGLISISLCPKNPIPVLPKETRFTLPRVFLSISSCTLSVFFSSLSSLSSILYPQLSAVRTIFGYFSFPNPKSHPHSSVISAAWFALQLGSVTP